MPSRKERCQFTIKPMLTTVGTFLQDIKREDNAIEKVEVFTTGTNQGCSNFSQVLQNLEDLMNV